MSHFRKGFATIHLRTQDVAGHTLRYSGKVQNFAYGRALVLAMPYPDKAKNGSRPLRQPTQMELRQAHRLGMHLFAAAMGGKRITQDYGMLEETGDRRHIDPITEIRQLPRPRYSAPRKPEEIAVAVVSMVRKMPSGEWLAGYYTDYLERKPVLVEATAPFKSLQLAGEWLCDNVGQTRINLGHPRRSAKLIPFPAEKERMETLKRIATQRRAEQLALDLRAIERGQKFARSRGKKEAVYGSFG